MLLKSIYNTTVEDIDACLWNPYLGISINNKAFTVDYLAAFLRWALPRSRQKVAFLIVDVIHRINNQVLDRSKPIPALEKAFRKADAVRERIAAAQSRISAQERKKLVVLEWLDITHDPDFVYNERILDEEFTSNREFREALAMIVQKNMGAIAKRLNGDRIATLSTYLLHELPELIAGFHFEGLHFNLNVYPGEIGAIYDELLEYEWFRSLLPRLRVPGPMASVEAYGGGDPGMLTENER